jgi:RNA polymerase sigma factor (sigma-70 family)
MSPWISDLYLRSQSDARLLSLTRDGHARAFAILVERYRAELLAQARRLGAPGSAEDVVQQTFLSAYAALIGGAEVGHLRGWLHAILRNTAIRTHAPVEAPLEGCDACGEPLEAVVERRASARSVISALDGLPSRQRQALLGSSLQGLSRAELASSLGVSEAAVRQLVHRARRALRGAVTALTPYPLARWLAASGPPAGAGTDVALSAGAASAGGLLAKVGVFAAAGAIATGVAVETHHGTHPTPVHHKSASHRGTVSRSRKPPTVRASTAAPVGVAYEYGSSQAAPKSASVGGAHRPGDGVGHTIGSGPIQRTPRLPVPSGSGSGRGSGSGSGSGSGAGSGSGSGSGPRPGSGSSTGNGSGSSSAGGSGSGPSPGSGSGSSPGSGSSSGDGSNSGSRGDAGSGRSSGGGNGSAGRDGSWNSPSNTGDTGSGSSSDSGTGANGGSGSGSGDASAQDPGGSGSSGNSSTTANFDGGGGSASPSGSSPTVDTSQSGDSTTIGQSLRDLRPSSDSSPVQDQ